MTPTRTPARLVALLLVAAGLFTVAPFPAAAAGTIRIEAEAYDRFSDLTTENQGNAPDYRAPGPDVFTCWSGAQACSNDHKVGAFFGGEWLEFDRAVPQQQRYAVVLRYGTRSSGAVAEVLVDGRSLGGQTTLPRTGHYDTQASKTLGEVELGAGRHTLRVIAHGPFTLDYLELQPESSSGGPAPPSPPPPTSPPAPAPSVVPPPVSRSSSARQWQPWEADLTSARSYANPYADVVLRVTFQSPSGRRLGAFGFWDGGSTFTVRTLFPEPGRWTWQTNASDTANQSLHGVRGIVEVSPASGSNPLFARGALRVSGDGSYLTYADGAPFFWLGDTAWAGPLKASDAEWEQYLDDRAAKGFTVIQIATAPTWAADRDMAGNRAWLGASGGQWNPAFWQAFERKVAAANRRGLVVLVVGVMEPDATSLPTGAARRFARQLAGRLNGFHVLFSPSFDSPYEPLGDLVGQELAAATSLGLVTQHPGTPSGQATNTHAERYFAQRYLHFSSNQTGHNGGDRERIARQEIAWNLSLARRSPRKPVVNLEGYYDNGGGQPGDSGANRGTARDARAGAYRSWLSGALGYSYGAVGIQDWVTAPGAATHWRAALGYASSRQMTVLRDLLTGLPWPMLEPAHERLREQPTLWSQRAVLAVTADRRMGLAYTPVSRMLALDMAAFSGAVRATWVNPTTGQRTTASGLLPPSGVQRFTPPAGGDDWVLLFQP
jgi:hypothetical protein